MNDEVKAAAERLVNEDEVQRYLYGCPDSLTDFEQDIKTVATWALGASAIEHVNCNAVKPCACRCSVCAVPEPAAPPTVAPHDAAEGG